MAEDFTSYVSKKGWRKPRKKLKDVLPIDQIHLDMITEECRIVDGRHEVVGNLYNELKYNKVLKSQRHNTILKDLLLCRISHPACKLATSSILKRYYMKEHDLDAIYRIMDEVFLNIDLIRLANLKAMEKKITNIL